MKNFQEYLAEKATVSKPAAVGKNFIKPGDCLLPSPEHVVNHRADGASNVTRKGSKKLKIATSAASQLIASAVGYILSGPLH